MVHTRAMITMRGGTDMNSQIVSKHSVRLRAETVAFAGLGLAGIVMTASAVSSMMNVVATRDQVATLSVAARAVAPADSAKQEVRAVDPRSIKLQLPWSPV